MCQTGCYRASSAGESVRGEVGVVAMLVYVTPLEGSFSLALFRSSARAVRNGNGGVLGLALGFYVMLVRYARL